MVLGTRKTLTEHWIIDFKKQNPDTIFNYVELWHIPMIDPQFCAQGYCEIFKNHPKKFLIIISQSCPHKTLPEQIFHIQQPNSSMLWFGMFQRKIHRVLLKGCHALSDNRRKKFDFPKSCPQSRLSEQILHIRPPNSSMLCLGMLQRKIHSVLLKEYHELFKNRPKKIWFSKSCPHTVLSEQILHMQPPKSSMLCFDMFQQKIYSVLLKVYHELFENRPKKFWFPKSCPQSRLSEQILWIPPPKSSMLCFDIFKWKINSVLRKGYHLVSPNRP